MHACDSVAAILSTKKSSFSHRTRAQNIHNTESFHFSFFKSSMTGETKGTAMVVAADQAELPPFKTGGTSFAKPCFHGLNALAGVELITIPYTLAQAGWFSLVFLVSMASVDRYTALLLKRCMESNPSIRSYAEVGQQAFGRKGRLIASIFMYAEVYLVPTGFLILEGDNLHKLFPDVGLEISGHFLGGKKFFTVVAGLVILPSMWLKDLSVLSFVSACGVLSAVVIICATFWVGAVDGVGFSAKTEMFNISRIPFALSLYAFCYGGHSMFPTMYSSMKDKSQFSQVMYISYGLTTLSFMAMAIPGYLMFGQNVLSQVTLNLPTNKISSKVVIYTVLAGPITKYAPLISPIVIGIEEWLTYKIWPVRILVRTLLLFSTVLLALAFPFFGLFLALVGAILNVTVSIVLPCICYLKISEAHKIWGLESMAIVGLVAMAVAVGSMGTYVSAKEAINRL